MSNLPKYNLGKDKKKDDWVLTDAKGQVCERYDTKAEALKGGVLKEAVGDAGGSVRVRKENNVIQEERTFPRSRDPKKSKG